ncbi:MAG: hypothetical protein JXA58_06920, partial [Dehalococcoidia bacterium]|nr:hypothetical protein [Dehalococcoidia bacterium]
MNRSLLLRACAVWLLLAACGVLNGVLREYAIRPLVGAAAGHLLSTLILCCVILLVSWLFVRRLKLTVRG